MNDKKKEIAFRRNAPYESNRITSKCKSFIFHLEFQVKLKIFKNTVTMCVTNQTARLISFDWFDKLFYVLDLPSFALYLFVTYTLLINYKQTFNTPFFKIYISVAIADLIFLINQKVYMIIWVGIF